jgi:predicted metal-dependent hydrolase
LIAMADAPTLAETVQRGVALFNRGRYFGAHEVWETAWRDAPAGERGFLEGLVQLAAGMHLRTRRGGTRGAVHLLAQALVLLEDYRPMHDDVDVEGLLADFEAYVAWVREVNRPHRLLDHGRIPRLRLA